MDDHRALLTGTSTIRTSTMSTQSAPSSLTQVLTIATLLILFSACGSSPTGASLEGHYVLQSVNGLALPARVSPMASTVVDSGVLVLESGHRYSLLLFSRTSTESGGERQQSETHGLVRPSASTREFRLVPQNLESDISGVMVMETMEAPKRIRLLGNLESSFEFLRR